MPTPTTAIIIGGGIAGPAAAIALRKIGVSCTIYELRAEPASMGGAIGISPNAVRVLDHWGLYENITKTGLSYEKIELFSIQSGKLLGRLPFGGKERFGYDSVRVGRSELQKLLLDAALEAGAEVNYGKKLIDVRENTDSITALFEDGSSATADLLLGCDGIHSNVRTRYVDSSRSPTYTGVSSAYGFVPATKITAPIHFDQPGMNMSRQGSLLTTFCDPEKTTIFLAAVMEVREQSGPDGWRARGKVADEVRKDLLARFESQRIPAIAQMAEGMDELYFYQVFTLSNDGPWSRGRAILIGDAAHAMPPGGQSVGLAFEDVIILTRLLSSSSDTDLAGIFARYDAIRRPRVHDQYRQAASRWEGVRTRSWWVQWIMEIFVGWYLWAIARHADESFSYDPMNDSL